MCVAAAWAGCPMPPPAFAADAPCDGGAAVVLDIPPDGGPALPAQVCAGQAAPASGVFLTTERAARIAGTCTASEVKAAQLAAALKAEPSASAGSLVIAGGVALVVGLAVGFFVGRK
jgi:hypothetical protein